MTSLSLEQEGILLCYLLTTAQSDPVQNTRRRRGAYLLCLRVSCMGKGQDCRLASRGSGECHHPPIQKNRLTNMRPPKDKVYSHWRRELLQLQQVLYKRSLNLAQSPASSSPCEPSDIYSSIRKLNVRVLILHWGSKMETKWNKY